MKNSIYHQDYVKHLFNKMSPSYERMNYITSFGFSIRWRNQMIKNFYLNEKEVEVIDLLTGMGETWGAIKRNFPKANITAVDFSEGMLKQARIKNITKYNNSVKILNQDILFNQLPSNQYDYVTCTFGLKTFNNEQLLVLASEIKRILKPGGQFSFIEVLILKINC